MHCKKKRKYKFRKEFLHLRCVSISRPQVASIIGWNVFEKYISEQRTYEPERTITKTIATGLVTFVRGIPE